MVYAGRYDDVREAPCGATPRPGDIVMLRNGWTPMKVRSVERDGGCTRITAIYGNNAETEPKRRSSLDFLLIAQEGEEVPERFREEVRNRFGRTATEMQRPRYEVKFDVPNINCRSVVRPELIREIARRQHDHIADALGYGLSRPEAKPNFSMKWPSVFGYDQGEKNMEECYEEDPIDLTGKLFETDDGRFGTLLATNSAGKMVLEIKGSGEVIAVDPGEATLVKPHTIMVKRIGVKPQTMHWQAKKDVVEVGDMLVNKEGTRYVVLEIDTEADTDRKAPEGLRRVPTEAVDL